MPSKYSHSVVLATYSSRRITSDVNDQHHNRSRSNASQQTHRSAHVPASKAATPPVQPRNQQTNSSNFRTSPSPSHHPRSIHRAASDVTRNDGASQGHQRDNSNHSLAPPSIQRPTKAKPAKQPQVRENPLNDPYEGYLQRMSRADTHSAERMQWSTMKAATEHKTANDGRQADRPASLVQMQHRRPPLLAVRPDSSRSVSKVIPSKLFSVQQFLDMSPRIDRPLMGTPSPTLQQECTPVPKHRRSSTSFIDSSDEEPNSPEWISRGRSSRSVTQPAPELSMGETRTASPAKGKPVATRADLTKKLPSIPLAEVDHDKERRKSRGSSHNSTQRTHARQYSADLDDNNISLPFQKHSPLRQSPILHFAYSNQVSIQPCTIDNGELEASPRIESRPSLDRGHKSLSTAEGEDADVDESGPRGAIYIHRRYYRSMDHEIPSNSPRPRLSPTNSSSTRSSLEDRPRVSPTNSYADTPTTATRPRISSSTSYSERSPRTPRFPMSPARSESAPPRMSEDEDRHILTDIHRLSKRPLNPMPNFGVPSILRTPKTSPPSSPVKPQHSPSSPRLKQARSSRFKQHTPSLPLPCITEATSEGIPADSDTYKLPEPSPLSSTGSSKENLSDCSTDVEKIEHDMLVAVELYATETEIGRPKPSIADTVVTLPQPNLDATSPQTSPSEVYPIAGLIHPALLHIDDSSGSDSSDREGEEDYAYPPDIRRYRYFQMPNKHESRTEDVTTTASSSPTAAAATPPNIPLHRPVPSSATARAATRPMTEDEDGMQSLMNALRAGPQVPRGQVVVRRKTAVERLEEMIQQTEAEAAERRRKKGVMGLVRMLAR